MTLRHFFSARSIFILAIIIFLVIDRFCFAEISQWREDQGTNIYLGLHFFEWDTPVGLISSIGIPNPNGMIVIGSLFAFLPGLVAISTMLGVLQAFAIFIWLFTIRLSKSSYWVAVAFPILSSLVLRADGAEFWNNVIYITFNVFYLAVLNLILKFRRPIFVTIAVMFILLSPSMYLAGISNAIAFTLLLALLIYLMQRRSETSLISYQIMDWIFLFMGIYLILYVVWIPYFTSVALQGIHGLSQQSLFARLNESLQVLYYVPMWLFQFTDIRLPVLYSGSNQGIALSWLTVRLSNLAALILKIQFIFFILLAAWELKKRGLRSQLKLNHFKYLSPFLLIFLIYFVTPVLGGPSLHAGQRLEMTRQLYPMFLFIVFAGPYFYTQNLGIIYKRACLFSACSYGIVSVICGVLFFVNVSNFSSSSLAESDVPLRDKVAAVRFIANDWKSENSSEIIEVDYDLAGPWSWVTKFGELILPYYPPVFTIGRALDYEFERVYHLKNYQEGVQERNIDVARYVVAYAHECKNLPNNLDIYYFGRICVKKRFNK